MRVVDLTGAPSSGPGLRRRAQAAAGSFDIGPSLPDPARRISTGVRGVPLRASWLLSCMVVLAACGGDRPALRASGDTEPWSIDRARVLFSARRGDARDLFVLDRASGDTTRITRYGEIGAGANAAALSPDGAHIAFQLVREGNYEIHRRALEGGETTNLTAHPDYDVSPVWSPDGRSIGFMSTRGFELGSIGPFPGHVYVMPADGGEPRRVTSEPLTSSFGPSDWSPDGKQMLIARVGGESGQPDVFLLEVATGNEVRLTDSPAGEYSAVFSHDRRRIAFHAETEGGSRIEIMDLDGGGRSALVSGPGFHYYPQWSPDDAWILFTASDDGSQFDIRAVHVDDGTVIEIVATPEDEREAIWL